ncbi:MAG: glycosyltransferase family 4 protein [Verrucomicrobia bacterium]|nr:glycosyltransferase family 4 protein [Verrucomicrobiota bacterium]MBI3870626.1 glycosyltransferase family 4 protein [Verrucomicrobiota bacterium]
MPESTTFGGGERVLLALSRYLHGQSMPHRFAWYYDNVKLAPRASWPVRENHLNPARRPLKKIQALDRFLKAAEGANSGSVLLVGIQAALHASLCSAEGYSLMILDTPSLLSPSPERPLGSLGAALRDQCTRPLIRKAMHKARTVIATTGYMAEEIKRLYHRTPVVIHQGAPQGRFLPRAPGPGEAVRMLSVCRLEANKRVDWILEAMAALRTEPAPGVLVDIVGAGSEAESLQNRCYRLGLSDCVTFHGRVDDDRLAALYRNAHLFLMPARQGYGLPALEALSCGMPVVLHRESGVSEILEGTPWAELMDGNAESLVAGIRRMLPRIASGEFTRAPLPRFPSEEEWAHAVCEECGWR